MHKASVLVVARRLVMTKEEWRERTRERTLPPFSLVPFLGEDGSLLVSPDGLRVEERTAFAAPGFIGVFAVRGSFAVELREEACSSLFGSPRRATRRIAVLRPWQPVRVILNGRRANYSGQTYTVGDYHFVLRAGLVPEALAPARLVDLQADLS